MTGSATGSPATVLVVDDEREVRTVMRVMLSRAGYGVVEAVNGREAVEAIAARPEEIDVVLLDIMMPEMDGHEALPALRENAPRLPIVFVSGYDRNEVADHLRAEGAYTAFLGKPFSKADLLAEVELALTHGDEAG